MNDDDIRSSGAKIYAELDERPLAALSRYESLSPEIRSALKPRFESVTEIIRSAKGIETPSGREMLLQRYVSLRRRDQKRLMTAVVQHLLNLSEVDDRATLHEIGRSVRQLVLEGTIQQLFFCKLASTLGVCASVPATLVRLVVRPMICALRIVLRVGAETTRDAAIEGLGALLKLDGHAQTRFAPDYFVEDGHGNPDLNKLYAVRLRRRREMVLAVAESVLRNEYVATVKQPIEDILAALRLKEAVIRSGPDGDPAAQAKALAQNYEDIETALYERADRLRILPAVLRQNAGVDLTDLVDALRAATVRLRSETTDPPAVHIAHARYQESVFRTIDVALRRNANAWKSLDQPIADAVKRIPRTMAGSPAVSNARIRATIAILRTAMSVVKKSTDSSETKKALLPLVRKLGDAKSWANLGIVEGFYRGLPEILDHPNHEGLYKPVLKSLFADINSEPPPGEPARSHRHLSALACFRRILITLADDAAEQQLKGDDKASLGTETKLDRSLRSLLNTPSLDTLQKVLRGELLGGDLDDIAESVISGIAFECDLLRAGRPAFQRWDGLPAVQKVILTRVLALQLHSVSRDAVEIGRYPYLSSVFSGMTSVAMPETEALKVVWDLLSSLPAGAAEAADPDIQRFVESRGRRQRATHDPADHAEDLPGYVLAMISPNASARIAGGISREIDLNLRHDRLHGREDLARSLYQVLLHGPHEAIFDHLLPRLRNEKHREMVMLFRDHVATVRSSEIAPHSGKYSIEALTTHVTSMSLRLNENWGSKTLNDLKHALELFRALVSTEEGELWSAIESRKHIDLFASFDALDVATRDRGVPDVEGHRKALEPRFHGRLIDLQSDVTTYMSLPLGNFQERSDLLRKAASTASGIEADLASDEDLQHPEKILLVALMQHLRDVFERTDRWFCVEMRRSLYKEKKSRFWILAAYSTNPVSLLIRRVRSGVIEKSLRSNYWQLDMWAELEATTKAAGPIPPRFSGQLDKYEEFAIDRMSEDLDAATLEEVLRDRWPRPYALLFDVMTNLSRIALVILLPCLWAIAMHAMAVHWLEGAGFYVLAVAVILAVIVGSTRFLERILVRRGDRDDGYWRQCVFPRLGRLIVVPMVLTVEVDHSYSFPAKASTWALLLLMMVAFLATQFFIKRLVRKENAPLYEKRPLTPYEQEQQERDDQEERIRSGRAVNTVLTPLDEEGRPLTQLEQEHEEKKERERDQAERLKARRVVSVALAYAFGVAFLFSIIFADSHHHPVSSKGAADDHAELTHDGDAEDFLFVLPRRAFLDFAEVWRVTGREPWSFVKEHGRFTYYPTLLLSWTAFGLFFGLVLEGIVKGESPIGRHKGETEV